ncbi:EAL and HDOD domain-containing protein [Rhodocyclaceae bacterium SMB388]
MARNDVFLGRQPILDRNGELFAYELLFRAGQVPDSNVTDDLHATANVISHAFGQLGAEAVLGSALGFINVSTEMLHSEVVEFLPPDKVVLELLETVAASEPVLQRCLDLKKAGFRIALDDFVFDESFVELLKIVDFVKIDLTLHQPDELAEIVSRLRQWPVCLLAEKVDTREQAEHCRALGFELFQGYYFARPVILSARRPDPSTNLLVELLQLLLGDGESAQIFDTIRRDPGLTYNLLRLVNSAAAGFARPIDSVSTAVAALGRRQLQRWVQLLLYSQDKGVSYPSPLMEMAASRGKTMEGLAQRQGLAPADLDTAFMTGTLSLLDNVMKQSMREIVARINLCAEVRDALLERGGPFGILLALVECIEHSDLDRASRLLKDAPGLSLADLTAAELDAMRWVVALHGRRT